MRQHFLRRPGKICLLPINPIGPAEIGNMGFCRNAGAAKESNLMMTLNHFPQSFQISHDGLLSDGMQKPVFLFYHFIEEKVNGELRDFLTIH